MMRSIMPQPKGEISMRLSARNQLSGTVKDVKIDGIMSEVTVTLQGGGEIVSVITASSTQRLSIKPSAAVTVVIKATEVMLASND
jgi:molybdopterin-binding protein